MNHQEKFISAIKRGTGEAYLLLQKFSDQFLEELKEACMTSYGYDAQSGDIREEYLLELVLISDHSEELIAHIKEQFLKAEGDSWDVTVLYQLMKELAITGDDNALKLLYQKIEDQIKNHDNGWGKGSLIEAGGLEALIFVLNLLGEKYLQTKNNYWIDDLLIFYLDESLQEKARAFIYQKAERNPNIHVYVKEVEKKEVPKDSSNAGKERDYFAELQEIIESKDSRKSYLVRLIAPKLSVQQLDQLAHQFIKETDLNRIEIYLQVFRKIKFPFRLDHLLEIYEKKELENEYLIIDSMAHFSDSRLQTLAIGKLKDNEEGLKYLNLLKKNWSDDLLDFLMELLKIHGDDEDNIHDIGFFLQDLIDNNPKANLQAPLIFYYKKSTCALCRQFIIKRLIDRNLLPDYIKEEAYYDCNFKTRKLIENIR